jgi:hypothetical protein
MPDPVSGEAILWFPGMCEEELFSHAPETLTVLCHSWYRIRSFVPSRWRPFLGPRRALRTAWNHLCYPNLLFAAVVGSCVAATKENELYPPRTLLWCKHGLTHTTMGRALWHGVL